jgi:hypothetical protein
LAGHTARIEEKRNACRLLVGKPEVKEHLEMPRRMWVNCIKIELRLDEVVRTRLI